MARWLAAAAGLALAACAAANPPAGANAAAVVEVTIAEYRFQPAELGIRAGTTVRWTNREKRTSHSVLFLGEGGYETGRMFPDESVSRSFDQPGTYAYTCGPHPEMSGTIEVLP